MELYAVHNTATPNVFYATPGKALLTFLISNSRKGTFGQFKRLGANVNQGALSLFQTAKEIVPGKVATEVEFLGPQEFYLSEFRTKNSIDTFAVSTLKLDFEVPTIKRKADGNIDATATLLNYADSLLHEPDKLQTITYSVEQFQVQSVTDQVEETQRYAINWEVLILSFIALVSLQKSLSQIEVELPKVSGTFLTTIPFNASRVSTVQPILVAPPIVRIPQATPSVLQSTLTAVNNQQVQCNVVEGKGPLAQIICGQLAIGPDWEAVMERNRCTVKGYKIAESLIKVAATRIFSIPEQSIMEPIVNSLDAYQPARKVGKFGMGFFSLLYWVLQDPKANLIITSSYREANFVKPCSYRAIISNVNGELYVEVTELQTIPTTETGFQLRLNFGDRISLETLNRFISQLNRLQYVTSAIIIVNQSIVLNAEAILLREKLEPQYKRPTQSILVSLNREFFSTEDKATGLPIETFYSTLIVPSISTKTIALSNRREVGFVDRSRITVKPPGSNDSDYNSFRITIGEVVIIDIKFYGTLDVSSATAVVLMTLPLQTRVPVSRDDVLLSSVPVEALAALLKLLDEDLAQFHDTTYVEEALLAFANETASSENLDMIKSFLNEIPQRLRDRQLIGVPVDQIYLYQQLGPNYVSTLNYDQAYLENYLRIHESSTDEFFLNKRVIFAPLPSEILATNGGTSSFIFVNQQFPQSSTFGDNRDWPVRLAVMYKRDILYPAGTNFGESLSKIALQYTEMFKDARSRLLMETLAGKYQAALDLREPQDNTVQNYLSVQVPVLILYLNETYYRLYNLEDFHSIIGSIITMLSSAEPDISLYGDRLTIRCVNVPYLERLLEVSQITMTMFIAAKNLQGKQFKLALYYSRTIDPRRLNLELHKKASQYQAALVDRSSRLAIQRKYLNQAIVDPFSAGYELNLVVELSYCLYSMEKSTSIDRVFLRLFIALLRDSSNAFQFILGYLLMYVVFKLLGPQQLGIRRVSTLPRELLTMLYKDSRSEKLANEVATVILSTVTKAFGASPGNSIQGYHRLILNGGIDTVFGYQNVFDAYFSDLYRPALDVYAYLERRVKVSGFIQEVDGGIAEQLAGKCYHFTLSKLVEFVFQEELPKANLELFQAVSAFKSRVPSRLQIIPLAVEAGTSRSSITAKLTELTQNSIDAIRQAMASGTQLIDPRIDIVVKKIRNRSELLLGISDPVGISAAGIVALSIPFLSGKQASEIVTGEIGSGFFNVYREAQRVLIVTTVNHETTEMLDVPILDPETGQIVDIERCATVRQSNLPNGTQILIQSRHSDLGLIDAAVEAISFTKETLALVGSTKITINLNGTVVNIPLTLVYQNDFFEFRCSATNFESYILTKGVPFAPLYKYLISLGFFKNFMWILEQLKTSVSLNIKSGVFTPVQTRTKIGLTRQNANLLVKSILEATFFVILFKIENKIIAESEIDQYLQYYSSTGIINQVLPNPSSSQTWSRLLQSLLPFVSQNLRTEGPSDEDRDRIMASLERIPNPFMAMDFSKTHQNFTLNSLLVTSAKVFPDIAKIQRYISSYVETAGLSADTFPGQTIFNLAYRWLVSKKPVPVELVRVNPGTINPQTGKPAKPIIVAEPRYLKGLLNPNHETFVQIWIEVYCRLAEQVIPGWPTGVPNVVLMLKRDSPFNGEYSASKNLLSLYYEYMILPKPREGLDYLSRIVEIFRTAAEINNAVLTLETNNPTWRAFFMPKGTIAHELEHYRAKDEHQKSAHGNVRMRLPYGGERDRVFLLQHHDIMLSLPNFYETVANEVRRNIR